ncbi:MAG: MASE3 domain-containing protein [Syntrophobacteraceae bacterium]|jgi:signal transduction histidine kinase
MFASGILPDRHTLSLGLALTAGLLWVSTLDYLVFHALIEIITVVATWGVFVTAWNSRYIVRNPCISFVGNAYLFVGLIDVLHILSYKSVSVFFNNPDLGSQLQIIARCMQAVSLLIAPFLFGKRFKTGYVFAAFSALTAGLLLSVFYWRNFPPCFIGEIVPTEFGKMSQNAVILVFLAAIFALFFKRNGLELSAFRTLLASISLSLLSELAFALHTLLLWPTEEPSLFLRLIATYLMYRVFLKIGIFAPFNTIFRNLSLSEKNLFSLLEGLPAFVFVQASDYRIQYANRVFRTLFGNPDGLTCFEVLKTKHKPCEVCPTREIFRTGLPQQRDWGVIKGKTYAIYEYPYRDLDDSVAVLKLGIDITDRKTMETELIAARNELEHRVQIRTAELTRINEALQFEVAERERIQESLEQAREDQRLLSLSLLHAQEMERKRIAMELHDSLGGSLSAIKFRTEHAIGQFEPSSDPKPLQMLDDIIVMLQNLIEEVRRIHQNIWPSILGDFGLIMAINWHCRKFEENYPHIHIEKSLSLKEDDTPDVLKIVIYRIIQEALNNVAKHSAADSVAILLDKENGAIELKIRDNGRGFNIAEAQTSSGAGVGLSGMRERAKLSGGFLEIQSGVIGTEIRALWSAHMITDLMVTKS